ncbi:FadR/GntR family transcriptional regulator [Arcticibacterium luteifluviistationis]|uniref:GntR family transcriptional regulator n=1 Tax=Arcticibacterium luteifluviistationis TaxID=1784714 RepID=A0A2Z4G7P0_9BACT|nr:FCD domain-containing protein [Arcticibacterium luteifluviistationis]AWV97125.1 GntR family transcriptional regulator [Arcticibacterium luteifluviistationis]
MSVEVYNDLKEIVVDMPVDEIVDQINGLISSGQLKAGDKIPSERFLSEKFNVGRMFVRDALSKLEFHGILEKVSQGGRVVVGTKDAALMSLATNTLSLVRPDYKSLLEVRLLLEVESAGLAAERADLDNIKALEEALDLLGNKIAEGEVGVDEDLMFHVRIAEASKNEVNKYLISYLVSHMSSFSKEYDICRNSRNLKAYNEHVIILEHIKNGDGQRARQSMREHLSSLVDFIPES